MSEWNNSYAYNNQYQHGLNEWNGDPNAQYVNQAYHTRPDGNGQYVSFNDFLSQMQSRNTVPQANSSAFNNVHFENYPPGLPYDYQNKASTSQTQPKKYVNGSPSVPNNTNTYPVNSQIPFTAQPEATTSSNIPFKSNLTATAVEFVPKCSALNPSTSSQNIPESTISFKESNEIDSESQLNYGNSSDRNWRQRPQGSQETSDVRYKPNEQSKNNERKGRNRDSFQRKDANLSQNEAQENYQNKPRSNEFHKNQDSQSQDLSQNYESNSHSREMSWNNDSNARSQEPRSNNRNQESRQNDVNQDSRQRNYDSNSKNRESHQNHDSRDQELREDTNQRYEKNDRRNQKGNPKFKGKDDNRTFYNSTISKDQNVKSSRGESSRNDARIESSKDGNSRAEGSRTGENPGRAPRNWAGTQRPRGDRNQDDEQYANKYNQREERDRSEKGERERNDRGEKERNDRVERERNDRGERERYDRGEREVYDRGERERYDRGERERYDRGERDRYDKGKDRRFNRQERERGSKSNTSSPAKFNNNKNQVGKEMTQRERLTDQLDKGTLECLVCCDRVRQTDPVWSCSNCYHVLHLRCIRKWALSSVVEGKWRCPACQNVSKTIPTEYRCMCGAMRSPEYQRGGSCAHTCGQACQRERVCPHPCTLQCHPGPCPPCQATVTKQCGCGVETRSVICSSKLPQICGRECKRTLTCLVHACVKECHEGDCEECNKEVTQVCYCLAGTERTVPCTVETGSLPHWECDRACGRVLACGAHVCRAQCHAPPCAQCALLPEAVCTCPCGKMQLDTNARQLCTDPIPLCDNICAKPLTCGPLGDKHFCKLICHEGDCPVCPDKSLVQCRCGHSSWEILCSKLPEKINNMLCIKKCVKKMSCGRHRCRVACCAATTHRCVVTCGRSLSCGLHRCEEFCHTGHCPPCPRVSFDELRCECGAAVVMPPVPCGHRVPPCERSCLRRRSCGHPPHHKCHTGECPPCVVLTTKRCLGGHEERTTIPCSQDEFSCGLPCGKPLPCGKHTCIKACHKAPCDGGKCTQPCTEKRPTCGHVCNAPCHSSSTNSTCPSATPCRVVVRATCLCGRRTAERTCSDNARDLAKIMSALAATKMQVGGAIEITEQRPANMLKTLECDDECRVEARTRQMALALQIRNPDVSAKLAPRYSDHLRTTATREPAFAQQVHDKLTELVQLAKKSKQKTRAHSFPSMNWQKRQFIHEMCEHFGCESVAYDAEPNRNVVATADKEKSWLPAMSLLEVLGREAGKRRVPGPVLRAPPVASTSAAGNTAKPASGWATLTSRSTTAWGARPAPAPAAAAVKPPSPPEDKIDYFDNPPDN